MQSRPGLPGASDLARQLLPEPVAVVLEVQPEALRVSSPGQEDRVLARGRPFAGRRLQERAGVAPPRARLAEYVVGVQPHARSSRGLHGQHHRHFSLWSGITPDIGDQ